MTNKRQIEICSAGCPACAETIELVRRAACPSCEIKILDMRESEVAAQAKEYAER